MISVSENFISTIGKPIETNIYGTAAMAVEGGTTYTINWDKHNVISGSFSVSDKCVKGSGFSVGAVNSSTLSATFYLPEISATAIQGAIIKAFYSALVDGATWESVPLGVFRVTKSSPQANGLIQITAVTSLYFANMFDTTDPALLPATYLNTLQEPYYHLASICQHAGLEFGNTIEEVRAMANGTELTAIPEDSTISATTDILSYMATFLGGFVTCDRATGKIIIKHFGRTSVATIAPSKVYKGSLSCAGFEMGIEKMSVTVYDNGAFSAYMANGLAEKSGNPNNIEIDISDNPFIETVYRQKGTDTVDNIVNITDRVMFLPYIPFSCDYAGNPALEVGDCVTVQKPDGTTFNSIITSVTYNFRGRHRLKCDGEDARLVGGIKVNDVARLERKVNRRINSVAPKHLTQEEFDTQLSGGNMRDGLYIITDGGGANE